MADASVAAAVGTPQLPPPPPPRRPRRRGWSRAPRGGLLRRAQSPANTRARAQTAAATAATKNGLIKGEIQVKKLFSIFFILTFLLCFKTGLRMGKLLGVVMKTKSQIENFPPFTVQVLSLPLLNGDSPAEAVAAFHCGAPPSRTRCKRSSSRSSSSLRKAKMKQKKESWGNEYQQGQGNTS